MQERYCEPNLVKTRLRRAFVSQLMPEQLVSELNDLGIITYKLGKSTNMSSELAYHPDILLNNFRKGLWLCESNAEYLPDEISRSIFRESETELSDLYPFDCPFNNLQLYKTLICGKNADYLIKAYAKYEEMRILYVPQNYTKCCCAVVNENAVITSDYYIGKTLRLNGFDVLTLNDTDEIGLRGFSHGLIGGCSVSISKTMLGFTGDLNKYRYGNDIRDFCSNYGVDAISLSNESLYDYGGVLPISEMIPYGEDIEEEFII